MTLRLAWDMQQVPILEKKVTKLNIKTILINQVTEKIHLKYYSYSSQQG